jgi:hypothetical protein
VKYTEEDKNLSWLFSEEDPTEGQLRYICYLHGVQVRKDLKRLKKINEKEIKLQMEIQARKGL